MLSKVFSANLQSQVNMENRWTGKKYHGPKLAGPEVHRKGALEGLLTLAMGLAQ